MSFRAFCVLGLFLLVIEADVAPAPPAETLKKTPAPSKRYDQSQEEYAREILKGKDIRELNAELLPVPDINTHKYILTDDANSVKGFLKSGNFIPKFAETKVWKVEDQTAFRLTVQNHYNNFMYCIQRIRIYEELETPQKMAKRLATNPDQETKSNTKMKVPFKKIPSVSTIGNFGSPQSSLEGQALAREAPSAGTVENVRSASRGRLQNKNMKTPRRKFKDTPRDDILSKCEGGFEVRPHTRYRFGFADTIFFYGANRIIFKIHDPNLAKADGFICHERSYTVSGKRDKVLNEQQCKTKLETIFVWKGTIKNLIWNLFHHPLSFITGHVFQEK